MILSPSDVDNAGVSVVSTTSFAADRGQYSSMYDFTRLACGDLRHVHPMPRGKFLLAYGTIWPTATPDNAGGFSAHTTKLNPSFFVVTPDSAGSLEAVIDRNGPPGEMNNLSRDPTELRLVGGQSIGSKVVYLRTGPVNLLSIYDTADGYVRYEKSVVLPDSVVGTFIVSWNRGLAENDGNIIVFGSRSDGALCMMQVPLLNIQESATWAYGSTRGWASSPDYLEAMLSVTGTPFSSIGAVSMVRDRTKIVLSICTPVGDQVYGQVWRTDHSPFGAWTPQGGAVPVGLLSDSSFLGSGLVLHNLHPNPENAAFDAPSIGAVLPYSISVGQGALSIKTSWGVWPLPRLGQ